jgi:iron complex transport system permease protein
VNSPVSVRPDRSRLGWAALVAAAAAVLVASLALGAVRLEAGEVLAALGGSGDALSRAVVLELRLPRVLGGFAIGAALALAGLLLQALFRNPLADPYVLGVSGGASVGALLALLGTSWWVGHATVGSSVAVGAFTGAAAAGAFVYAAGARRGTTGLLLAGVLVAAASGAVVTLLLTVADSSALRGMVFWLAGDLSQLQGRGPTGTLLVALLALALCMLAGGPLNALASGELRAQAIGLDLARWRLIVFAAAAALTASAVVAAGTIGFVGLMAAHGARALLGTADHRRLAPATALLGGTFVAAADLLARTVIEPRQLPVGGVVALLGAPLFLLLLRRGAR